MTRKKRARILTLQTSSERYQTRKREYGSSPIPSTQPRSRAALTPAMPRMVHGRRR